MEFNGQYLTYEDYKALGGETLDLMPFNLLEFEARRKIDIRTFNRLKNINSNDIPQEVKICVYKLINSMSGYDKTLSSAFDKGTIASENIDGYSVSYANSSEVSEILKAKTSELNDIIRENLAGVIVNGQHILYAGVDE